MAVLWSKTLAVIQEKAPLTPRGSATPKSALEVVCQTLPLQAPVPRRHD